MLQSTVCLDFYTWSFLQFSLYFLYLLNLLFFYFHFALQTLWEGGFYKLQLTFPQDYPFSPPKCELSSEIRNKRRHWPRPFPVAVLCACSMRRPPYCHPPNSLSKFLLGNTWMQGCALRKIEFRVPSIRFKWKIWDFLVARGQKLGAWGQRALLEHSPVNVLAGDRFWFVSDLHVTFMVGQHCKMFICFRCIQSCDSASKCVSFWQSIFITDWQKQRMEASNHNQGGTSGFLLNKFSHCTVLDS